MGLIYAELLLRNRILRAIFKKYPKGIVWNSVCFYDKKFGMKLYPQVFVKFANRFTLVVETFGNLQL